MNTPNPDLMELYGTDAYYLEKVGFLSPGLLMAGARAGTGLGSLLWARMDAKHREEMTAEANELNHRFRVLEARKMSAVVDSFGGPSDPMASMRPLDKMSSLDPRLVKIAEELGVKLAREEMAKEAVPSVGSMWKGVKNFAGGLVKKAPHGGPAITPGFKPPGVTTNAVPKIGRTGTIAQAPGAAAAAKPATAAGSVAAHAPAPGKAGLTGAPVPGPKPANMGGTAGEVNAAAQEAAKVEAARNAPRKPLLSTGTKIGLGIAGAGAIGTAGLVGSQGLMAARDYMMTPMQQNQTWGGYGPSPVHNVNQYGYVQPQF